MRIFFLTRSTVPLGVSSSRNRDAKDSDGYDGTRGYRRHGRRLRRGYVPSATLYVAHEYDFTNEISCGDTCIDISSRENINELGLLGFITLSRGDKRFSNLNDSLVCPFDATDLATGM
ncbi:unnamed protein product [Lasius platythorax]|uniref:Uncharacterized protein n=1 Tax=Lasius platythorax TaxID=488582 RepID=A0AAV2P1B4_9HYME